MSYIENNFLFCLLYLYIVFSIFINLSSLKNIFNFEKGFVGEDFKDISERKYRNKVVFLSNITLFINGMFFWLILSIYNMFKKEITDKSLSIIFPLYGLVNIYLKKLGNKSYDMFIEDEKRITYCFNGLVKYYKGDLLHREDLAEPKLGEESKVLPAIHNRTSLIKMKHKDSRWYCYGEKVICSNYKEFNKKRIKKTVGNF
jgi:hypothetical protein